MPNFCSTTMRLAMVLVPNLATFTYAMPHQIPALAIAGAILPDRTLPNVPAQPAVARSPSVIRVARNALVKETSKTDAWRIADTTPLDENAVIADARLSQRKVASAGKEGIEWEVEAPITFSYRVRECPGVLDPASDALIYGHISDDATLARAKSRVLKRVVVVDEEVHAIYGEEIEAYFAAHNVQMRLLVLPTTEENKNMDMVLEIAEAIHDLGIDRRIDPVIAIGGGVCMDIVGFAASIYRRRTPYIRVPTTLMGYVDASVGAKSGVNFAGKKNKLGAYLPPALTLLDPTFLYSLPSRQLANGAAEIVKMALVKDPELLELLAKHGPELIANKFQPLETAGSPGSPDEIAARSAPGRVLHLAIQTMLEELAPNLWEDSLERLVDFGHVFSMELEMEMLHEEKLFHGEAVAIDMAFCSVLSHVRGHLEMPTLQLILDTMRGLELPVYHPALNSEMTAFALYERIKFSSGQKIPLPTGFGVARIFEDITQEQMDEALTLWTELCA